MKHNAIITANALAVTTGLIYVVCAVLVVLFPDLSLTVFQSWFHGLDISKLALANVTVGTFVLGLATITAFAWGTGYLFVWVSNKLAK